jgi:hypothetical protein
VSLVEDVNVADPAAVYVAAPADETVVSVKVNAFPAPLVRTTLPVVPDVKLIDPVPEEVVRVASPEELIEVSLNVNVAPAPLVTLTVAADVSSTVPAPAAETVVI